MLAAAANYVCEACEPGARVLVVVTVVLGVGICKHEQALEMAGASRPRRAVGVGTMATEIPMARAATACAPGVKAAS